MIFGILQRFGNLLIVKERFTKYDIEKDKTSGQFFSIGAGKLLGPADLLLEKDLMILMVLSGVVGQKKKDFKILTFKYVICHMKSKTLLCFKEHGVHVLFLPTLTIQQISSQVFDRSV